MTCIQDDFCLQYPYCWHYFSYFGEAWTDNRQGKPRRIALIRSVWHLSRDSELLTIIHTAWFNQRSVAHAAARNSYRTHRRRTGQGTTQESLSLID